MYLVLKSYIYPLARSPLAAGINWATACIAPQKKPAKLENTRKEDKTDGKDVIEKPAHGIDDSVLQFEANIDKVGTRMDDVNEELAKLHAEANEGRARFEAGVQELKEGVEGLIRALKARGLPI